MSTSEQSVLRGTQSCSPAFRSCMHANTQPCQPYGCDYLSAAAAARQGLRVQGAHPTAHAARAAHSPAALPSRLHACMKSALPAIRLRLSQPSLLHRGSTANMVRSGHIRNHLLSCDLLSPAADRPRNCVPWRARWCCVHMMLACSRQHSIKQHAGMWMQCGEHARDKSLPVLNWCQALSRDHGAASGAAGASGCAGPAWGGAGCRCVVQRATHSSSMPWSLLQQQRLLRRQPHTHRRRMHAARRHRRAPYLRRARAFVHHPRMQASGRTRIQRPRQL